MSDEYDPIDFEQAFSDILGHREDRTKPYDRIGASSLGYCDRGRLTSKLGLKEFPAHVEATMFVGSAVHEYLQDEDWYDGQLGDFEQELAETYVDEDGECTEIMGHVDARADTGEPLDWKTIAGMSHVQNSPQDHHEDQMQAYLNLADEDRGEVVYIRRWIDKDSDDPMPVVQHTVERDEDYFENELVPRAHRTREQAAEYGPILEDAGEIPESVLPEKCDGFFCRVEDLDGRVLDAGEGGR